jgi:phosphate transport system ATP-binding protein
MEDARMSVIAPENTAAAVRGLNLYYGDSQALKDVNLAFERQCIHSILGPSGCGKSTLLRCLNRLHELNDGVRIEGAIEMDGTDLLAMDPIHVRRRTGMVFQRPNPFPTMSIHDNVVSGFAINGLKLRKDEADWVVERSLRRATLWDEVRDKLHQKGGHLSGGQQQRLCIARALAMEPEILLLDEPTSALDPIATGNIENLMHELKRDVTVILVTHNISQAGRVSDHVAFMYLGELVEYDTAAEMFFRPKDQRTERYLTGAFG